MYENRIFKRDACNEVTRETRATAVKYLGKLAGAFQKSMSDYSSKASWSFNSDEFFKQERQPNGYVVKGENRTITDIGSKSKNIEGEIDLSNLVSHGGGASPLKKLGEWLRNGADILDKMKSASSVGDAVLNTSSSQEVEAKINQTTQQNMGVKQRKTLDDIKVDGIYHGRSTGINYRKLKDNTSQIAPNTKTNDTL